MDKIKNNKLTLSILTALVLAGTATSVVTIAGAASSGTAITGANAQMPMGGMMGMRGSNRENDLRTPPAAVGKVVTISGSTITLTDPMNNTTYTVDASKASVQKDRDAAGAITDIKVGDIIMVEGTLSGTSISATEIHEGLGGMGMRGHGGGTVGTVTSVSGTMLSVTGNDGGTYTVDATTASVRANGAASTISGIKVGDTVMVQGLITTASITAKDIEDGMPKPPTTSTTQ
jgi:hypothetical protein